MMNRKTVAIALVMLMLLAVLPAPALASSTVDMAISVTPSTVKVGEEVEVIVSLTGYTTDAAAADAIKGLQVDITNVDTSVLEVVESESLISDSSALSNATSVQLSKKLVRLLYMQMSGTLRAPCENVMRVKFRIKAELTESGSITLPVSMKIQSENNELTLKEDLVIDYTISQEESGEIGVKASVSPAQVEAGGEVEAVISLTGYTAEAAAENAIQGFQLDITNVDSNVLEVVEYKSLIQDSSALQNTPSYQANGNLLRLLYMQVSGKTLPAPYEDVMRVKLRVKANVEESGSINLPVTLKLQMVDNQQLTVKSAFAIQYTVSEEEPEGIGAKTSVSPAEVKAGEEVEAVVTLTGYTAKAAEEDGIRGLQIDITNVDSNVLEVVKHETLIVDDSAFTNTTSNQSDSQLVRLLYMRMNGTLSAPYTNVMRVKFRVKSGVKESGSITLPVKVKIQLENSSLTLEKELVISYTVDTTAVTSVDITWGAMEFTYSDGSWNPSNHSYVGGGWDNSNQGFVTVSNVGTTDVTASFAYQTERKDIAGAFVNASGGAVSTFSLTAGENATVYLKLSGKPQETLDKTVIGSVTVRIGGE